MKFDGFPKRPSAALPFTFVLAAYLVSTPHSTGFVRLASGAFYFAIVLMTFNTKKPIFILRGAQRGMKVLRDHKI
jgi:hypothetical protein